MSLEPARSRPRLGLIAAGAACALALAPPTAPSEAPAFDVLIRGGTLYDGSGGPPRRGDLGLRGDRIEAAGDLGGATDLLADPRSRRGVAPNVASHVGTGTRATA